MTEIRQSCICGADLFQIAYDDRAQGFGVSCNGCGRSMGGLQSTGRDLEDISPDPGLADMAPPCVNCGSRIRYACCPGCPGRVEPEDRPDVASAWVAHSDDLAADDFTADPYRDPDAAWAAGDDEARSDGAS